MWCPEHNCRISEEGICQMDGIVCKWHGDTLRRLLGTGGRLECALCVVEDAIRNAQPI